MFFSYCIVCATYCLIIHFANKCKGVCHLHKCLRNLLRHYALPWSFEKNRFLINFHKMLNLRSNVRKWHPGASVTNANSRKKNCFYFLRLLFFAKRVNLWWKNHEFSLVTSGPALGKILPLRWMCTSFIYLFIFCFHFYLLWD